MAGLAILRTYASRDPVDIPPTIRFTSNESSLVIYDAYPKSIFHFLVLPRVNNSKSRTASLLSNLWTLLKSDKSVAKEIICNLAEMAGEVKKDIEEEMVKRYGFTWGVWMGFHGNPSMEHLHLHVLSDDLCSDRMKVKKHYNSFHPKLGFFIHLEEVQEWFEAEPSYYLSMIRRDRKGFEPLLKEPLSCWKCNQEFKNMPTLKVHLQEEQDRVSKRLGTRRIKDNIEETGSGQQGKKPKKNGHGEEGEANP